jgi:hypothetical protein
MLNDMMIYEYPHTKRIVVIGDIHGDIKRFKKILNDAKIINDDLEWIAEPSETIVVQVGDQIDSMNRVPTTDWEILDDTNMLYFTDSLDNIAKVKGGSVISLIGNHELMNVLGNFSFVSPKSNFPMRHKYFMPTGVLSSILAKRPIVLKIGELFFCHAGIKKQHLDVLDSHNKGINYINEVWRQFVLTGKVLIEDKPIFEDIILNQHNGILWTRTIDTEDDAAYVMKKIGCEYIFIGHNPVEKVKLLNQRLWLTDTGISRAFGEKSYQYIDINDYSILVKTITEQ